jgi:hypothetical protein
MNEKEALSVIKEIYDDGKMTINGNDYEFTKTTHKKRLKIFSFLSSVKNKLAETDFSWMDGQQFAGIEETIGNIVMFDGQLVSKIQDHWENNPGDYITYITTAMMVISYPFTAGKSGN